MPPTPPFRNRRMQRIKPLRVSFVSFFVINRGIKIAIIRMITDNSSYTEKASFRKRVSNKNGIITLPAPPKTDMYTRLILSKASIFNKTEAMHTNEYRKANINGCILSGTEPFARQKKYTAAIGCAISIYRFKDVLMPIVEIV